MRKFGSLVTLIDRAIAQAVSRWLFIAAFRFRARVWSGGICGGQSGAETDFLASTSVSPANLHSTTITRGRYNRPEVAEVPSEPSMDSTSHYANFKR
jgi:hypothetical protein